MNIKSVVLASTLLTLIPTIASADIVTETFTGTVFGTDFGGYFGTLNGHYTNAAYTATFVFDTSLGAPYNSAGAFGVYGGSAYGAGAPTDPLISATLTINNVSYSFGTSGVIQNRNVDSGSGFEAFSEALPATGSSEFYNQIQSFSSTAPYPTSLTSPFSYTAQPGDGVQGQFFIENVENLNLTPIKVTLVDGVPEPATWAMMLLGFAGIGFMAYRRKAKPTLMAACIRLN